MATAALGTQAPKRFLWKGYADWAYRHQVCIKNWAEGILVLGSGLTKVNEAVPKAGGPSQLTLTQIQELLLMKEGWARNEENPSIPEHITKAALRVVSWSDGWFFHDTSICLVLTYTPRGQSSTL